MELVDDEIGVAVEFHEDEDEREDEGEMDEIVVRTYYLDFRFAL